MEGKEFMVIFVIYHSLHWEMSEKIIVMAGSIFGMFTVTHTFHQSLDSHYLIIIDLTGPVSLVFP